MFSIFPFYISLVRFFFLINLEKLYYKNENLDLFFQHYNNHINFSIKIIEKVLLKFIQMFNLIY